MRTFVTEVFRAIINNLRDRYVIHGGEWNWTSQTHAPVDVREFAY